MIATKKCACGCPATKAVMGTGGFGVAIGYLCDAHWSEAEECARRMIALTGLEWYSIPAGFRPENCFARDEP